MDTDSYTDQAEDEEIVAIKALIRDPELAGLYQAFYRAKAGRDSCEAMWVIADWWEEHGNARVALEIRKIWNAGGM